MLDLNTIVYQLPIEVDTAKILTELENLVFPNLEKDIINDLNPDDKIGLNITNIKFTQNNKWYNTHRGNMDLLKDMNTGEELTRLYSTHTLGFPGSWRNNVEAFYSNGPGDKDFTCWHPDLIDGEMYRLNNRIAEHFNIINKLRCRASFIGAGGQLKFHSDPHTPWRVHVNLKSKQGATWRFRTLESEKTLEWLQPLNSVWLIRTGNVQHSVEVGQDDIRWQLYYHIWQRDLGPEYIFI